MSIFDTTDPNQAANLMLAAGLLSGRGSFSSILGDSLMGAQQAYQGAQTYGLQARQRKQQMEEAEKAAQQRQRDMDLLRRQFQGQFNPQAMLGEGASPDSVLQAIQLQQAMTPKKKEPLKAGPGDQFFDPDTYQPLASVPHKPDKPPEPPSAVQEYEYAKGQGYKGSFQQWDTARRRAGASNTSVTYGAPVAGVDANGNPVFFQPSKEGGAPAIVPGVKPQPPKADKPTESQSKAQAFYDQMAAASRTLEQSKVNMSSLPAQLDTMIAGSPLNILASSGAQKVRQSQEQWAEAFLRFKTGAASTEAEVKRNVKTFFPQHGDSAAVVEQKRAMRAEAEKSVLQAAQAAPAAPQQPKRLKFDAQGNPVN